MKIRVTLKYPDVLHDAVFNDVEAALRTEAPTLTEEERDVVAETRRESVRKIIVDRWMAYGEYLTVEFDTDAGTATVVERGQ